MNDLVKLRGAVIKTSEMVDRYTAAGRRKVEEDGVKISCGKKCVGCCYIIATVTLPEMIHAVIAAREARHRFNTKLVQDQFIKVSHPSMTTEEWANAEHRCPVLRHDDLCAIYDARPHTCRVHLVISPRTQCAPPTKGTMGLDLSNYLEFAIPNMAAIAREVDIPLVYAPLQFVLPVAMMAVDQGFAAATQMLRAMGMDREDSMLRWLNFAA